MKIKKVLLCLPITIAFACAEPSSKGSIATEEHYEISVIWNSGSIQRTIAINRDFDSMALTKFSNSSLSSKNYFMDKTTMDSVYQFTMKEIQEANFSTEKPISDYGNEPFALFIHCKNKGYSVQYDGLNFLNSSNTNIKGIRRQFEKSSAALD